MTLESLYALKIGRTLLDEFKKCNPQEYAKIMSEPIKGCKCGFIKEGDEEICPKCEKEKIQ